MLLHADPAMRWALCRLLAVVLGLVCLLPLCFLVISVCRPASPPCCWPLLSAWCGTTPLNFQPFWLLHGLLTVASGLALFHPPCFPTRLLAAVFSLVCVHFGSQRHAAWVCPGSCLRCRASRGRHMIAACCQRHRLFHDADCCQGTFFQQNLEISHTLKRARKNKTTNTAKRQ